MLRNTLTNYFDAVEQHLNTLPNSYVEQFNAVILTTERANLKLRIRFKGKYLLAISEALIATTNQVSQIDYRYHFQDENNELIFRYDSTPHFPNLSSFPHHKHLPDTVIATDKPNIFQIFQEASALVEAEN
ncbi:hypothetical protein D0962_12385 [Leptolyngbyaceae cyanobacterium CCMR0082]|uniref:Uncharacterized protein n=1 Tax=Adonisia turfae CCMR0082 TaxID=2304604 RepID=A0A6M0S6G7_9CYAN|nr:DUF6516 family protein [Adonisia turfae]NEZ63571.1 hypothetical protein [Adonisia turfae CCMR0082]